MGDSRAKLIDIFGQYQSSGSEKDKRVEYRQYGFFAELNELKSKQYLTSFGIGYKDYCKDGLAELEKILNATS